jgi:hypothetical protein
MPFTIMIRFIWNLFFVGDVNYNQISLVKAIDLTGTIPSPSPKPSCPIPSPGMWNRKQPLDFKRLEWKANVWSNSRCLKIVVGRSRARARGMPGWANNSGVLEQSEPSSQIARPHIARPHTVTHGGKQTSTTSVFCLTADGCHAWYVLLFKTYVGRQRI